MENIRRSLRITILFFTIIFVISSDINGFEPLLGNSDAKRAALEKGCRGLTEVRQMLEGHGRGAMDMSCDLLCNH
jgi:hypothetical protein